MSQLWSRRDEGGGRVKGGERVEEGWRGGGRVKGGERVEKGWRVEKKYVNEWMDRKTRWIKEMDGWMDGWMNERSGWMDK